MMNLIDVGTATKLIKVAFGARHVECRERKLAGWGTSSSDYELMSGDCSVQFLTNCFLFFLSFHDLQEGVATVSENS